MRVLRIMRMVRALRVLRLVRMFRALRIMVASILSSMVSLIWALVLLVVVLYLFSICFLQGVVSEMENMSAAEIEDTEGLLEFYDSVAKGMLTLFMAISGGYDWYELMKPLQRLENSGLYVSAFVFFVFFVVFGVMNILTGIFVDAASRIDEVDKELVVDEEMHKREEDFDEFRMIFDLIDRDGNNFIDRDEAESALCHREVAAYLRTLQFSFQDTEELFNGLEMGGHHEINVDDFTSQLMEVRGPARRLDFKTLLNSQNLIRNSMDHTLGSILRELVQLRKDREKEKEKENRHWHSSLAAHL